MILTSLTTLVLLTAKPSSGVTALTLPPLIVDNTSAPLTSLTPPCPNFGEIPHGYAELTSSGPDQIAIIECDEGYDLDGAPKVQCIGGQWEAIPRPQCNQRCLPPPYLHNGSLEIEGDKDENGLFHKGTLATYSCSEGFKLTPEESKYRVCEKGIWTGIYASCEPIKKISNCPAPKEIANGYFVHEKTGDEGFDVGQRLHYSCKSGYVLDGTPVQQCLEDGTWSPKIPPVCSLSIGGESSNEINKNSNFNTVNLLTVVLF